MVYKLPITGGQYVLHWFTNFSSLLILWHMVVASLLDIKKYYIDMISTEANVFKVNKKENWPMSVAFFLVHFDHIQCNIQLITPPFLRKNSYIFTKSKLLKQERRTGKLNKNGLRMKDVYNSRFWLKSSG